MGPSAGSPTVDLDRGCLSYAGSVAKLRMMVCIGCLVTLAACAGDEPATTVATESAVTSTQESEPMSPEILDVAVPAEGLDLAASLRLPERSGPVPAVVSHPWQRAGSS